MAAILSAFTVPPVQVPPATGISATDKPNIAAAITAAGVNGTLYFPNGTYVADSLAPLSGQTWYGPGVLKLTPSTTNSLIAATGITGATFRGMTFDGNKASQSASGTNGLFSLVSASNCLITGCTFQNTYSAASFVGTAAVQLRMPQNCTVNECYVNNCGYGIEVGSLNTDTTHMYGNVVSGCILNNTAWDGIFITENLGSVAATPTGFLHGTVITGCTLQQVGDAAIEVGSGSPGTAVSGCTVDNFANTAVGNNGIIIRDSQDVSVTGCTIRNLLKSGAIGILMLNLNGTSGNGKANQNITIDGCVLDTVDTGIEDNASVTGGLVITGCIVNKHSQTSAGSAGIILNATAEFTLSDTIVSNGSGVPGSNEGVNLTACHDGTVTGCTIYNNTGNDGLICNNTAFSIMISGNRIGPGNTTNAMRIFDAGSHDIQVLGNNFDGNGAGGSLGLNGTPGAGIVARGNSVYNPFGSETVAVPLTTVAVAATQHDRTYYVTAGAGGATTMAIQNGPTVTVPTSACVPVRVPAGKTVTPTYTSAPTWVVEGE